MNDRWDARLAPYRRPSTARSVWQLVEHGSAVRRGVGAHVREPRASGYWLTLLLAVPAAFLLIRLFIIQHDCGHGAFFRSSRAADIVGSIIGVLTLTPYHYWKKTHAMHHATSGQSRASRVRRHRHPDRGRVPRPVALAAVQVPRVPPSGGAVRRRRRAALLRAHRLPTIVPRDWTRERRSIFWTDVGLAGLHRRRWACWSGSGSSCWCTLPLMTLSARSASGCSTSSTSSSRPTGSTTSAGRTTTRR